MCDSHLYDLLLPNFLPQMHTFVVNRQMIMAPEALATFFTLVCFLICSEHGLNLSTCCVEEVTGQLYSPFY